jgi:hypothetical protein
VRLNMTGAGCAQGPSRWPDMPGEYVIDDHCNFAHGLAVLLATAHSGPSLWKLRQSGPMRPAHRVPALAAGDTRPEVPCGWLSGAR